MTEHGGNIWLMKHRKPVAAVVTMKDAHVLGEVQGRPMHEMMERLNLNLGRMGAAKAVEDEYDRIKLAKGTYKPIMMAWGPDGYREVDQESR